MDTTRLSQLTRSSSFATAFGVSQRVRRIKSHNENQTAALPRSIKESRPIESPSLYLRTNAIVDSVSCTSGNPARISEATMMCC